MLHAESGGDLFVEAANYGLLGLLVVAFITGLVVPAWVIKDKDKQLEAKNAEIDYLKTELAHVRQRTEEKIGPALAETASVVKEAIRVLDRRRT